MENPGGTRPRRSRSSRRFLCTYQRSSSSLATMSGATSRSVIGSTSSSLRRVTRFSDVIKASSNTSYPSIDIAGSMASRVSRSSGSRATRIARVVGAVSFFLRASATVPDSGGSDERRQHSERTFPASIARSSAPSTSGPEPPTSRLICTMRSGSAPSS